MEQGVTSESQVQILKCLECYTRRFQSCTEGIDKSLRDPYAKGLPDQILWMFSEALIGKSDEEKNGEKLRENKNLMKAVIVRRNK